MDMKTYIKSGCKLYDDCFTCPYPDCYEFKVKSILAKRLKDEVKTMRQSGLSVMSIAKRIGRSKSSVRRMLNG